MAMPIEPKEDVIHLRTTRSESDNSGGKTINDAERGSWRVRGLWGGGRALYLIVRINTGM